MVIEAAGSASAADQPARLFVPTELVLQKIGLRPAVDAQPRVAS
jgi:hypothetical protein